MFKALVGRGHPEFSTNRQQDAQEFLLHFINMVEVKLAPLCSSFSSPALILHHIYIYVFLLPTEELPFWPQPIWSLQVFGGGEDCVSAITKSQVHTEGGLYPPAASAHGPGHQHRWELLGYKHWQMLTGSGCGVKPNFDTGWIQGVFRKIQFYKY